jgi:hypothetical protein
LRRDWENGRERQEGGNKDAINDSKNVDKQAEPAKSEWAVANVVATEFCQGEKQDWDNIRDVKG